MKRKQPSEAQIQARLRNSNKGQIMGQISLMNIILNHGNINYEESKQLKEAQDILKSIIKNWSPTV